MNNPLIYNAVLTGISGSTQNLTIRSSRTADYNDFGTRAALLALAVDSLIAPTTVSEDEARLISAIAGGIDFNRCLQGTTPDYSAIAADIVRIWTEMSARIVFTPSDATVTVDKYEDLWLLTDETYSKAYIKGRNSPNDGGEGWFTNKPVGTYVEDYGTTAVAGSRAWVRDDLAKDYVYAEWFGINTGLDDTEAFTRALALSVGTTYNAWIAGGGDAVRGVAHAAKPVRYAHNVVLKATIDIRYQGVQIEGPHQYGEGYAAATGRLIIYHNDVAFRVFTGPDIATPFMPSLSLTGVVSTRGAPYVATSDHFILIDGVYWFRGLQITSCHIQNNKSVVKIGALYEASSGTTSNCASGLCIQNSIFSNNREYAIDTGSIVSWDLSRVANCGFDHNTIGAMRMKLRGGIIERIDCEGGGNGGELWLENSRAGYFYFESTLDYAKPALTIYASNSIVEPFSDVTAHRFATVKVVDSYGSKINTGKAASLINCSDIEAPNGWAADYPYATDVTGIKTSCAHICELAPYLAHRPSMQSPAALLTTYTDPTRHTSMRNFNGYPMDAALIGTYAGAAASATFTVPVSIVAGHTYLVGLAINHRDRPTELTSMVTITGLGSVALQRANRTCNNDTQQFVIIFTAAANATELEVVVRPYSAVGGPTGRYAAVSPVTVWEVGGTYYRSIEQLHIPALISGVRAAPMYIEQQVKGSAPVNVGAGATVEVYRREVNTLQVSSIFVTTLTYKVAVWDPGNLTVCGTISGSVDLSASTDAWGVPNLAIKAATTPDVSRLPAGLAGATVTVSTPSTGARLYAIALSVTAPGGLAVASRASVQFDEFLRLGVGP